MSSWSPISTSPLYRPDLVMLDNYFDRGKNQIVFGLRQGQLQVLERQVQPEPAWKRPLLQHAQDQAGFSGRHPVRTRLRRL